MKTDALRRGHAEARVYSQLIQRKPRAEGTHSETLEEICITATHTYVLQTLVELGCETMATQLL